MYMSHWHRAPPSDRDVHVERVLRVHGYGYTGGYSGWVYRVQYPPSHRALRSQPPDSDHRERALPCRGRVVRKQAGTDPSA